MFQVTWIIAIITTLMQLTDTMHTFKTQEECVEFAEVHKGKMDYFFKGAFGLVPEAPLVVSYICTPKEEPKVQPETKADAL